MCAYVMAHRPKEVFDPAVGAGVFLLTARELARESCQDVGLSGREIDPAPLVEALHNGLTQEDLARVELRDFVLDPPTKRLSAIVANPPYIRHHRLSMNVKSRLRQMTAKMSGLTLDGRAGYHVYFLLRALSLLEEGGRLAFIMPADTCEGVFSDNLWRWVTSRFRLDGVVTFLPNATPFPGVDTNAVVFLIENAAPKKAIAWIQCKEPTDQLEQAARELLPSESTNLSVVERNLVEALETGLSRPVRMETGDTVRLGMFAAAMRGIATGCNEFFLFNREQVERLGLAEFVVPIVAKTRYVQGDEFTKADFVELAAAGKHCYLLSLDGRPLDLFPKAVRQYLAKGVQDSIDSNTLISTRKPWYKMEKRVVPPYLFAYLGRRNARFIRNSAGVVPLTGFLCIYPTPGIELAKLWRVLQDPQVNENLKLVGKSYGGGAIKVEPRKLEQLPIPIELLLTHGLELPKREPNLLDPLEEPVDATLRKFPLSS